MIRPPRSVRVGTALIGVAGALTLAGCSSTTPAQDTSAADPSDALTPGLTGEYVDGTYAASGSYQTPESVETVDVTVTLADGVVTDVEVTGDPQTAETTQYQGRFIGGISDEVVGVPLDEVSVSRVAGSSLTSGGFMKAIEQIKSDAAR